MLTLSPLSSSSLNPQLPSRFFLSFILSKYCRLAFGSRRQPTRNYSLVSFSLSSSLIIITLAPLSSPTLYYYFLSSSLHSSLIIAISLSYPLYHPPSNRFFLSIILSHFTLPRVSTRNYTRVSSSLSSSQITVLSSVFLNITHSQPSSRTFLSITFSHYYPLGCLRVTTLSFCTLYHTL